MSGGERPPATGVHVVGLIPASPLVRVTPLTVRAPVFVTIAVKVVVSPTPRPAEGLAEPLTESRPWGRR